MIRTLGTAAAAAAALTAAAAGTANAASAPQHDGPRSVDPATAQLYHEFGGDNATVAGDGRMVGSPNMSVGNIGEIPQKALTGADAVQNMVAQHMPAGQPATIPDGVNSALTQVTAPVAGPLSGVTGQLG